MKQIRKSLLTLLTLTLFGGAGAWAQGPTQVTQFTTDLIASWATDNNDITLADLQALGFVAVDESVAQAWTGAPQDGYALLVYGFNEGNGYIMSMVFNHGNVNPPDQGSISKGDFYDMIAHGEKFFYTGAPSPVIELTKSGANQWSLGQTPDYDLELQVEYYEAHALKNIPAGWTVMVDGVDKTAAIDGDSLNIVETDSVTLIPDNPRRVKSFTLKDDLPPVVPLDNTTTAWTAGTYVVPAGGLTYSDAITVSGDVTLVLTDGETLTLNKGISLASGATLTVEGNGTMNVNGTNNSTASTVAGTGTLVLTSGTLTATGGNGQGGWDSGTGAAGGAAINGTVIVDGGTLTAKGGNGGNLGYMAVQGQGGAGGAAISGSVTVNDGTLTATGGKGGNVGSDSVVSHGGAGGAAIGGSLTINAGTMTTTNGAAGSVGSDSDECSGGAAGKAVTGTVTDNR